MGLCGTNKKWASKSHTHNKKRVDFKNLKCKTNLKIAETSILKREK